jgi:hypothetical protein
MSGDPLATARDLTRGLAVLIEEAAKHPERREELPTLAGLLINQIATAVSIECGPVDFFAAGPGVDAVAYANKVFAHAEIIGATIGEVFAHEQDATRRADAVRKLTCEGALNAAVAGAACAVADQ